MLYSQFERFVSWCDDLGIDLGISETYYLDLVKMYTGVNILNANQLIFWKSLQIVITLCQQLVSWPICIVFLLPITATG